MKKMEESKREKEEQFQIRISHGATACGWDEGDKEIEGKDFRTPKSSVVVSVTPFVNDPPCVSFENFGDTDGILGLHDIKKVIANGVCLKTTILKKDGSRITMQYDPKDDKIIVHRDKRIQELPFVDYSYGTNLEWSSNKERNKEIIDYHDRDSDQGDRMIIEKTQIAEPDAVATATEN